MKTPLVIVVIPCYRVRAKLRGVVGRIGPEVGRIIIVDDACPENSSQAVVGQDPRLEIIVHEKNRGVGGAMRTGFERAIALGADIVVKLDGDGQMDPAAIPSLIAPVLAGEADFCKCNRFFHLADLREMPWLRVFGNSSLSFLVKASSGYWQLMDPTNGFFALDAKLVRLLPLDRIARDYFFEIDLLFRLYTIGAVVAEVPQAARYEDENSSLSIGQTLLTFPHRIIRSFCKRIFYAYFLRDFNLGTIYLTVGLLATSFGVNFGIWHWLLSAATGRFSSPGTVMLAALPTALGLQMLLAFLQFDVARVPRDPLAKRLFYLPK